MQQDFFPYAIDRVSLNLKEHPTISIHDAETLSAVEDVKIASGQAVYEHSESDLHNTWSVATNDEQQLNDFLLENFIPSSATIDPACNHRTSTPGLGSFGSSFSSQPPSHASLRDQGSWGPLQASALGASSAPGRGYTSTPPYQGGGLIQFPHDLTEPESSIGSSYRSHNYDQASPLQQRLLRESQSAQIMRINSFPSRLQYTPRQCPEVPLKDRSERGHANGRERGSEAKKTPVSDLSSLLQDDYPILPSLATSTNGRLVTPRHCRKETLGDERMENDLVHTSDECDDESIARGLPNELWEGLPSEDLQTLTTDELFWQQELDLTSAADEVFGGDNIECGPAGQALRAMDQISTPNCLHRGAYQCNTHDATSEAVLDCPGAITIPGSSKRYDADLASSFPPTAGHFPAHVPNFRTPVHDQSAFSSFQSPRTISKYTSLPMRRKNSKAKTPGRSRSGSLKVIPEHNNRLGTSPTGSLRGRRRGHLDRITALAAGQKRTEGTVCIRCKMMKQTCEGNLPCEGCRRNSYARSWGQPCQKARFIDMIEAGTCNAVFQASASVHPIDRKARLCLRYSGGFNIEEIIDRLLDRKFRYNIRVRHFSGASYTLDLAKLSKLMSTVQEADIVGQYELDDFGRCKTSKASDWLQCVTDCDESVSVIQRFIVWNNMPSRNGYLYAPLNGPSLHPMDISNNGDESDTLLAVQLCRIVLRALEVSAFRALQKKVNDLPQNRVSDTEIESLAQELVKVLFSLRWRISWWAVYGISSNIQADLSSRYTERVSMLTQTLYFWYFVVRRRLPVRISSASKGLWNIYADAAQPVLDEFPKDESIEGYHTWMARGRSVIHRAYVQPSVPQP